MGIQGLWRYLENHNLSRHLGTSSDKLEPQHLLLDMNAIMHKCYDPRKPTTESTIDAVLKSVKTFIMRFPPNKSLTLVFDGVAPTAKLSTQRERRRKTVIGAPAAASKGIELQQGQIVTGSVFIHKCEEAVINMLRKLLGQGDIKTSEPVFVSSYHSPGEGDTKLFKRLHALAADSLSKGTYDPDDIVVIVGSDCDLVLGCAACTPYHNLFLMSPVTHLLTDIGELFIHWMKRSSGDLIPLDMLPSVRIDFVFCVALSGGDHFNGIEEKAIEIWRRYRNLRYDGGFFRKPLVMNNQFQLAWDLLTQIVSRDRRALMANFSGSKNKTARKKAELAKEAENGGNGDVQSGIELLKGALWSVAAYTEGKPPAMDAKFHSANPKPASIRVVCARGKQHVAVPRTDYESLPPISVYLGAIGMKSLTPAPFDEIMSLPIHKNFSNLTADGPILAHITQMLATAQNLQHKMDNPSSSSSAVTISSADQLNRTDEDDLLDAAIANAESAKQQQHNKNIATTTTTTAASTANEASAPATALSKRKEKAQAILDAALHASQEQINNMTFNIADDIKPLLVTRPSNEWITITLSGPIVTKPSVLLAAAAAAAAAAAVKEAEEQDNATAATSEEPNTKVAVTETKPPQKKNAKKGPPPKKSSTKGSASSTAAPSTSEPSESLHPQNPNDEPLHVAAAINATQISSVLLKEATTATTKSGMNLRDGNGVIAAQAPTCFTETLNTIDFKYPDSVTKVRISSVIVTRRFPSAANATTADEEKKQIVEEENDNVAGNDSDESD